MRVRDWEGPGSSRLYRVLSKHGVHGVAIVEGEGHRTPPQKQPDNESKLLVKGVVWKNGNEKKPGSSYHLICTSAFYTS